VHDRAFLQIEAVRRHAREDGEHGRQLRLVADQHDGLEPVRALRQGLEQRPHAELRVELLQHADLAVLRLLSEDLGRLHRPDERAGEDQIELAAAEPREGPRRLPEAPPALAGERPETVGNAVFSTDRDAMPHQVDVHLVPSGEAEHSNPGTPYVNPSGLVTYGVPAIRLVEVLYQHRKMGQA